MKNDLVAMQNKLFGTLTEIIQEQKDIIRQQQEQLDKQSKVLKYLYEDIDQFLQTELNTDASTLTARVYSSRSSGNKSMDSLAIGLTDIREVLGSDLRKRGS